MDPYSYNPNVVQGPQYGPATPQSQYYPRLQDPSGSYQNVYMSQYTQTPQSTNQGVGGSHLGSGTTGAPHFVSPQVSAQTGQSGVRPGTNPGINAVNGPPEARGVHSPNGVSQGVNAGQNSQAAWDSVEKANGLANSDTNTTAWKDIVHTGQAGIGSTPNGGNVSTNTGHMASPTNQITSQPGGTNLSIGGGANTRDPNSMNARYF